MPVVIPSGYAQITLNYSLVGSASGHAATVLGFGGPGDIVATADEFAAAAVDAWEANLAPITCALVTLDSVYWATTDQSGVVNAGIVGTRTGDMEMVNVAFLSTYYTGFKGPRARGRSYWPGLINSADTGDAATIGSGRLATIQGALDDFFEFLEAPGLLDTHQVILQRDEPDQKSEPITPPPPVNRRAYSNRPATQRRRLRR